MQTIHWTRLFPTVVLIGYFSLGMVTRAADEVFPVFSWFLYHITPNKPTHYEVRVLEVDGKPLPAPLLYNDAREFLSPTAGDDTALKLMDSVGRAFKKSDAVTLDAYRRALESTYMPRVTRYAIAEISYHPLEYWKTKRREVRELQTFEVTKP